MTAVTIIMLLLMFVAVLSERWQWIPSEMKDFFGQLSGMLALCVVVIGLLFGVLLGGCLVTDKIVSTHSLSTKDAPGFSEEKFARINVGMSAGSVKSILGEPLTVSRKPEGKEEWGYTAPKEPIEGWGTWNARYFIVSNDAVIEICRRQLMNH